MYSQSVTFEVECYAVIDARGELTDYGVPGSPAWTDYEVSDWGDSTVDIAGVTVKLSELPETLQNALWDAAIEAVDDDKWEIE